MDTQSLITRLFFKNTNESRSSNKCLFISIVSTYVKILLLKLKRKNYSFLFISFQVPTNYSVYSGRGERHDTSRTLVNGRRIVRRTVRRIRNTQKYSFIRLYFVKLQKRTHQGAGGLDQFFFLNVNLTVVWKCKF